MLTTEVLPNTPYRTNACVVGKNAIAAQVMAAEGIPVLDLYSVSVGLQSEHVTATDVHFTDTGSQALGAAVLNSLQTEYGFQ